MSKAIQWTPEIVPNGGIDETRAPTQIADNAWTTASNVEPLPDGVRTRQGTSKSNTLALQQIALSFESGTNSRAFADGSSEYIAQSFTTVGALSVRRVAARLKISSGAPTGNVAAAFYTNSAVEPGSVVTGADFTDFAEVTAASITSQYLWHYWTLASPVTLTAATVYHLVLRHSGAAAANEFSAQEVTTPSGYSGGQVHFATTLGAWTQVIAADLNFRIYSGSMAITGITDYWLSDGTTQRHLVLHDKEVYKNVAGTMTSVSARDRVGLTSSANIFPSWAVANDREMIAHGTDTPKKFYVLSGTEYWENQGISPPTATPTASAVAGGSLAVGTYEIDYQYWNNDLGIPSNFRYQGVSALTQATAGADLTLRIANLPSDVVREGDRATHIRIYLKLQGTDTIFTFAGSGAGQGQVAIGTTTLDITSRATSQQAEYDHGVPPSHTMNLAAEQRQFVAGDPSFPYRVWHSYISGTTPYYESFATTGYRDFGKGEGDYVTCLRFVPPNYVLVGMKNSVWLMDARRPATSDRLLISRGIGISGDNAAIVVGRTVYFVSDADRSKGMFVWRGSGEPVPVFGVDDTFKALNQARLKYASCAHYAPGDNRFQWWTLVSSSAQSVPDRVLMYDYGLNAWTVYDLDGNILGEVDSSGVTRIFVGGTDGFERQADSGTQDDSTAISASFTMKAYDFASQEILKRMRWIDYVALAKTSGSINLTLQYDFGARPPSSAVTLSHTAASGTTGTWGTSAWGGGHIWGASVENVIGRVSVSGFGKVTQPVVNATAPFHLKSLSLAVQATGRRG